MSNHTQRTIPRPKEEIALPSSWKGGVWQLTILTAFAIFYVVYDGWGNSESQTAFRETLIILCLLALGTACVLQQMHRARVAAAAKARR